MNYEQKYKEALETVQEVLSSGADAIRIKTLKLRLQSVFPELAESWDEKIRKWIIDDIRYNINNEPLNNSEYKKEAEKAIAWLEK